MNIVLVVGARLNVWELGDEVVPVQVEFSTLKVEPVVSVMCERELRTMEAQIHFCERHWKIPQRMELQHQCLD